MLIASVTLVFKSQGYRHILRELVRWAFESSVQRKGRFIPYCFGQQKHFREAHELIHLQTFNLALRNLRPQSTPLHSTISPTVAGGHQASVFRPMAAHSKHIKLIAELLHSLGPGDKAIKTL